MPLTLSREEGPVTSKRADALIAKARKELGLGES